ncbi:MAG: peroxiredoxin family protein [Bacteroidales bacterium]
MKKILLYTFLIGLLAVTVSCNNERSEENGQASDKSKPSSYAEHKDPATNEATDAANQNTRAENKTGGNDASGQVTKPGATGGTASQQQSSAGTKQQTTTTNRTNAQNTTVIPEDIVIGNEVGNDLGDFESYDQDSVIRRLSDARGKLTMMVLWNSKCGHCVEENEVYREAYNQYHDKDFVNGDGFEVYAIGLDKVRETWVETLEEKQYPWKYNVYVLDSWKDRDIRFFGIKNLPGTFLIDENGIVLAKKFTGDELMTLLAGYEKK